MVVSGVYSLLIDFAGAWFDITNGQLMIFEDGVWMDAANVKSPQY
jgi:hypothetical protein